MLDLVVKKTLSFVRKPARAVVHATPVLSSFVGYVLFKSTHSSTLSRYKNADPKIVDAIRRDGFAVIPNFWPLEECQRAIADLDEILEKQPHHASTAGGDLRVFGAEVLSETIMKFHVDPMLADLSNHVVCAKTANAFTLASRVTPEMWTIPQDGGWHRDSRYRQFKAFLYLSDVGRNNGPIQLIRGSHRMPQYLRDMRNGRLSFTSNAFRDAQINDIIKTDPSRLVTFVAPAGTLIVADTGTLHRGSPPRKGRRYVLTNYYFEKNDLTPENVDAFAPVDRQKMLRLRETL